MSNRITFTYETQSSMATTLSEMSYEELAVLKEELTTIWHKFYCADNNSALQNVTWALFNIVLLGVTKKNDQVVKKYFEPELPAEKCEAEKVEVESTF